MGRTAVEDFAHHLTRAEHGPLTIKNYRCDLAAFALWFRDTTGDELTPAPITPTDLRDDKRFLKVFQSCGFCYLLTEQYPCE